jgi:hypothetical protein
MAVPAHLASVRLWEGHAGRHRNFSGGLHIPFGKLRVHLIDVLGLLEERLHSLAGYLLCNASHIEGFAPKTPETIILAGSGFILLLLI